MIKIAYVINTFSVGGAELHLYSLVKEIAENEEFEIYVIYLRAENKFSTSLVKYFEEIKNVKLYSPNINKYNILPGILRLYNFFLKEQFIVVHTLLFRADLLVALLKPIFRFKHILSIHASFVIGEHYPILLRRFVDFIYQFPLKHADQIVFISKFLREFYVTKYPFLHRCQLNTIYYGKILRPFSLSSKMNTLDTFDFSTNYFVSIGRIDSNKNYDLVFEALSLISMSKKIFFKYVIIGHNEFGLFEKLLKKYSNIKDHVVYLGFVSDIDKFLKNSKFFLFPSISEGFGVSLIEAMSLGVFPVVSNSGSFNEIIIQNYNGLYFESGNPNSLAEVIIDIFYNNNSILHSNIIIENIRKTADKFSNTSLMVNSYIEIYKN